VAFPHFGHLFTAPCAHGSSESGFPFNAAPSIDYLASGLFRPSLSLHKRGSERTLPGILAWYGGADPSVANIVPSAHHRYGQSCGAGERVSGTAMTLVIRDRAGITVASTSAPAYFYTANTTLTPA